MPNWKPGFKWARTVNAAFTERREKLAFAVAQTWIARATPIRIGVGVLRNMGAHDATQMAAGISYYLLLSLFPLLLGLGAILGLAAGSAGHQQQLVQFVTGYLPGSQDFILRSVDGVVRFRGALGILSILGLLWTARALFGAITGVVERAFGIRKNSPFLKGILLQLLMEAGVFVLFVFSAIASSLLLLATEVELGDRTIAKILGGHLVAYLLAAPAVLITLLIFATLYKLVPSTPTRWREVLPAAVIATVLFDTAKYLFLWYLRHLASYDQIYGTLASVVVLMVWTYVSAIVLIIGAEVAAEHARLRLKTEATTGVG